MVEKVKNLAEKYFSKIQEIRHHLHAHPELSFEEEETSEYIASKLKEMGISFERGWGGHGIKAELLIKPEFPTIALRADIDALPILEENTVPYKSKNTGIMHACGHDVHTSCLLGAIMILKDLKEDLNANFRFIFQPAEEKLPGGASILIREGILKNPVPKGIFGQHVHPPLEVGKLGFKSGLYMASADEIYITVKGKGGHAALPYENIDPIYMASSILMNLQHLVSRRANPSIPTVLSFGKINSEGGSTNVVPTFVKIEGTFRTMDEKWRNESHSLIKKIAQNTAKAMGGACEVNIIKGYPFLKNDEGLTLFAKSCAIEYLGRDHVVDLPIRLTAEDFSYYSQEIPASFYRLGTGNPARGITSSVHTPTFDIDEEALKVGSGFMAYLAYKNSHNI